MRETNSPWERLPNEGRKPWEAFETYRNMGPDRTVRAVGQKLDKNFRLIGRWSSAYGWVDRVSKWDAHQAARDAHQAEVRRKRLEKQRADADELEQERKLRLREKLGTLAETRIDAKQTGPQLRTISAKDSNGNPVEIKSADLAVPELLEMYERVDGWISNPFGVEKRNGMLAFTEVQLAALDACERLDSPRLIAAGPAQVVEADTECAA